MFQQQLKHLGSVIPFLIASQLHKWSLHVPEIEAGVESYANYVMLIDFGAEVLKL